MSYPFEPSRPEQGPFLQCSYSYLPHSKALHSELKCPMFLAITPIPPQTSPVQISAPIQAVGRCRHCQGFANPYCQYLDNGSYKCNFCQKDPKLDQNRMVFQEQKTELVYDCRFPFQCEHPKRLHPISYVNTIYLVVLELSESTYAGNLYLETLDKLYDFFTNLNSGFATIFVYNNGLLAPTINRDEYKFTVSLHVDLETTDIPDSDSILFNVDEDKEMFTKYIEYLRTLKPAPVRHDLCEILNYLHECTPEETYNPLILCSETRINSAEELRNMANRTIQNADTSDILAVEPIHGSNDFSPIFYYTSMLCGFFRYYKRLESDQIPFDFISRLHQTHMIGLSILINIPKCLKIVDIHGSGLRSGDTCYEQSIVCTGDTIFAEIEYNASYIPQTLDIQVVARFRDTGFRRYARVMNLRLSTRNNQTDVFNTINFDVLLSGAVARAISMTRIDGFDSRKQNIFEFGSKFLQNQLNIDRQLDVRRYRIRQLIAVAPKLLDDVTSAFLFGHSIEEIVGYLSPETWKLSRETGASDVTMLCDARPGPGTVLLVKLSSSKAYIFADDAETANYILVQTQNSDSAIFREIWAKIGSARVAIICPQINPQHPLISYTYTMMSALH